MNLKDYEYYRTDLGVFYCGDCLEILPLLQQHEWAIMSEGEPEICLKCEESIRDVDRNSNCNDKIDLVLTDPPYGIEYHSNYYKEGNPFGKIENDKTYFNIIIKLIEIANKAVFSFCRWDNIYDLPKPKSFIVWAKNNWSAGDLKHEYGRMWEGILFYPQINHKFKKRKADIIRCDRVPSSDLSHPTEKPVGLLKELIENNSNKNDLILDPFIGSGTTAVACEKLGRRWIGIEISEKYCEIAKRRIEYEYNKLKLDFTSKGGVDEKSRRSLKRSL